MEKESFLHYLSPLNDMELFDNNEGVAPPYDCIKPAARGGVIGAAAGGLVSLVVNSDPSDSIVYGALIGAAVDSAQYGTRYAGHCAIKCLGEFFLNIIGSSDGPVIDINELENITDEDISKL